MSRYSQDVRDGLTATWKAAADRYVAHASSPDPTMRTPFRMKRLEGHALEAKAALDQHIETHGPNGTGPEAPKFGIFAHFGGETHQIFIDGGRPLTVDDISKHYPIVEKAQ